MRAVATISTVALMAGPAIAGDPAAGERDWRQCRACHMIVDDAGNEIQRGGRVGPNLYGIAGRQAASVDGFRYSSDLSTAGEGGLHWDEESFVEYVKDPTAFLRSVLNDNSARSSMAYQMRSGAADMWAYLESVGPDAD